jgi:hypothetical protein
MGALGLSRRSHPCVPFIDIVQRSVLLDLTGLQCDLCDVETWILSDSNGIKLGGVESSCYASKCAGQCSVSRCFPRDPDTSSGTGAQNPHEVPTRLADHGIENRRRNFIHAGPMIANGRPQRIQTLWQNAPFAQKN